MALVFVSLWKFNAFSILTDLYSSGNRKELYQLVTPESQEGAAENSKVALIVSSDLANGVLGVVDFNNQSSSPESIKVSPKTKVEQILYHKDGYDWTFVDELPLEEARYLQFKRLDSSWLAVGSVIRYFGEGTEKSPLTKIQILPIRLR